MNFGDLRVLSLVWFGRKNCVGILLETEIPCFTRTQVSFQPEEHELAGSNRFLRSSKPVCGLRGLHFNLGPVWEGTQDVPKEPDPGARATWVRILALLLSSRVTLSMTLISPGLSYSIWKRKTLVSVSSYGPFSKKTPWGLSHWGHKPWPTLSTNHYQVARLRLHDFHSSGVTPLFFPWLCNKTK